MPNASVAPESRRFDTPMWTAISYGLMILTAACFSAAVLMIPLDKTTYVSKLFEVSASGENTPPPFCIDKTGATQKFIK